MDSHDDVLSGKKQLSSTSVLLKTLSSPTNTASHQSDRVTIGLYSIETIDSLGYTDSFLKEFANIEKIRDGLVNAATKAGREPPEFIVLVLLVPDWDRKDNSYYDKDYLKKNSNFLIAAKNKFETIRDLLVEDFYSTCVIRVEYQEYMHGLKAMGSNADMIKTIAIINNCHRRHLQIDSNTVVPSFDELYNQTFNAEEQKDGINASFYDNDYISAHNKMVYTTPDGGIAKNSQLGLRLLEWCRSHRNDNNVDQDKEPKKNSIYARVFTEALCHIGYVKLYVTANGKARYPATLTPQVYWLTQCMVTAVNMSWNAAQSPSIAREVKNISSILIGRDGVFNLQCFVNAIKKHTSNLRLHSVMLGLYDETSTGEESRKRLLSVSNNDLELKAVKEFYENTFRISPQLACELSVLFPNSPQGNHLAYRLFNCTVAELQEQAKINLDMSVPKSSHNLDTLSSEAKIVEEDGKRHGPSVS